MLYLLDTHVLIWYFTGSRKLRSRSKNLIDETRETGGHLLVPTIVLAESYYVHAKNPKLLDYRDLYEHVLKDDTFVIVDFTKEILERATRVDNVAELHDRIIVATAQEFKSGILTQDRIIRDSGEVETL